MTAVYLSWIAEFVLEALGAYLNFRRSKLLSLILGMCAAGEILTAVIFHFTPNAYAWSFWVYTCAKYLGFIWLVCWICGMFMAETSKGQSRIAAGMITAGIAAFVTVAYCSAANLRGSLLTAEVAANIVLVGIIALAWIGKRGVLTAAWKWITAGLLTMIASDLILTAWWILQPKGPAGSLYFLGETAALAVWVIGPLKSHKLAEARVSLPKKYAEVQKVSVM